MVRSPSIDKNGVKRGAWSEEEDNMLKAYVERYGHWNWRQLPRFAGLKRCGKSCRLRWMNYLRPGLKKGAFSEEEEEMIIKLHEELGNKWSTIAEKLPGRTDNEIKNYWNSHLKKCMKQDPKSTGKTEERSQNMMVMDQKELSSSISPKESTDQKKQLDTDIPIASTEENSSSSYDYSTLLGGAEDSFTSEESFPKFFESFWTEPFYPCTSYSQISSPTSYSSVLDIEDWATENGTSLEESFAESFQGLSTEPISSNASDGLISPSLRCYSIDTNMEEPVFSSPSNDLISPSSSSNSTITNWTEPAFSNPSNDLISPSSSSNSTCTNWTEPVFSNPSNDLISPPTSHNSTFTNSEAYINDASGCFWTEFSSLDTSYNQNIHQLPPMEQGVMFPSTSFFEHDLDLFNQF